MRQEVTPYLFFLYNAGTVQQCARPNSMFKKGLAFLWTSWALNLRNCTHDAGTTAARLIIPSRLHEHSTDGGAVLTHRHGPKTVSKLFHCVCVTRMGHAEACGTAASSLRILLSFCCQSGLETFCDKQRGNHCMIKHHHCTANMKHGLGPCCDWKGPHPLSLI